MPPALGSRCCQDTTLSFLPPQSGLLQLTQPQLCARGLFENIGMGIGALPTPGAPRSWCLTPSSLTLGKVILRGGLCMVSQSFLYQIKLQLPSVGSWLSNPAFLIPFSGPLSLSPVSVSSQINHLRLSACFKVCVWVPQTKRHGLWPLEDKSSIFSVFSSALVPLPLPA